MFFCFRYYAIVHPLKAQYLCTISKAKKTVLVTWTSAFILALPILWVQVCKLYVKVSLIPFRFRYVMEKSEQYPNVPNFCSPFCLDKVQALI